MNEDEFPRLLEELIAKYDQARDAWLKEYGDDHGFNQWFRAQVVGQHAQREEARTLARAEQ